MAHRKGSCDRSHFCRIHQRFEKASGALQKSDTLKDAVISQKADSLQGPVVPEPVTGMKQYKSI